MVRPGVRVEGHKLLIQNLKRIRTDYPKELRNIHRKVAEPVARLAARKVRSRTGDLASSIISGGTTKSGFIKAGEHSVLYAAVNHWGGYPGDYQGNPFLTDAIEEQETQIVQDWTLLTDQFIARVWIDS